MKIEAWVKGFTDRTSAEGTHGGYAAFVLVDGEASFSTSGYLGDLSDYACEYVAVAAALEHILTLQRDWNKETSSVITHSDCKMVVWQMNGRWLAHGGEYLPYYERAASLESMLKEPCRFRWIPTHQNLKCYQMAQDAIQKHIGSPENIVQWPNKQS